MPPWWHKYRELIEFAGLTILAPCLVYGCMFGSLTPHTDAQQLIGAGLAIAGMVIWVARHH